MIFLCFPWCKLIQQSNFKFTGDYIHIGIQIQSAFQTLRGFTLDIVEKLAILEGERSSINPGPEVRENWDALVQNLINDAISKKESGPAYRVAPDNKPIIEDDFAIHKTGRDMETAMNHLSEKVVSYGVQIGHPNYLAYIPGSDNYLSALGDYLGAAINPYTGVAITNPGAAAMQQALIKWVGAFLGYKGSFAGDITSGGSHANLTAIVTARDFLKIQPEDIRQTTVYYSEHAHHSVNKALHIAGMEYCKQRLIACNPDFSISVDELKKTVQKDKKAGLKPWLIVANAGTTDTGTVDDLNAMADIAKQYACWFHVDGAYGAGFALCALGKEELRGIERADSIVFDPHKSLFLSFGCGVVLIKNGAALRRAHHFIGNYMRDPGVDTTDSPSSNSAELTRPFRALRMWLPLTVLGTDPFRAALEEKMLLARYAHEKLNKIDHLWVGPLPQLSIVVFRYQSEDAEHDEKINQDFIEEIIADGEFYISTTELNGKATLRLAILTTRTNREAIDNFILMIEKKVKSLSTEVKST
ncbi:MAG: aromatic-L-amino-acid decarboxylase [Planctomycetota bacterium]